MVGAFLGPLNGFMACLLALVAGTALASLCVAWRVLRLAPSEHAAAPRVCAGRRTRARQDPVRRGHCARRRCRRPATGVGDRASLGVDLVSLAIHPSASGRLPQAHGRVSARRARAAPAGARRDRARRALARRPDRETSAQRGHAHARTTVGASRPDRADRRESAEFHAARGQGRGQAAARRQRELAIRAHGTRPELGARRSDAQRLRRPRAGAARGLRQARASADRARAQGQPRQPRQSVRGHVHAGECGRPIRHFRQLRPPRVHLRPGGHGQDLRDAPAVAAVSRRRADSARDCDRRNDRAGLRPVAAQGGRRRRPPEHHAPARPRRPLRSVRTPRHRHRRRAHARPARRAATSNRAASTRRRCSSRPTTACSSSTTSAGKRLRPTRC